MKREVSMKLKVISKIAAVAFATAIFSGQAFATALNSNLIVNPGAETDTGVFNSSSTKVPSGWQREGNFTVVSYGQGGLQDITVSNNFSGGKNYFFGGPSTATFDNKSSRAWQTINISDVAANVDQGQITANLSGYLGGYSSQTDNMSLYALFIDSNNGTIGQLQIGPVTDKDRNNKNDLLKRQGSKIVILS